MRALAVFIKRLLCKHERFEVFEYVESEHEHAEGDRWGVKACLDCGKRTEHDWRRV